MILELSRPVPQVSPKKILLVPREHGAWSMLLAPFVCGAILARQWNWLELIALTAVVATFLAKDPLIILARQRFLWKQPKPETEVARRWLAVEGALLALCGLLLMRAWPWQALVSLAAGAAGFSILAVILTLQNRQRSTLFQIASAIALTSSSLAACLSATGTIPSWCWCLWLLNTLQAGTAILVVHARLEARIAGRKGLPLAGKFRSPAIAAAIVLLIGGVVAGTTGHAFVCAALLLASAGYLYDLARQRRTASLQMPLTQTGLQALALSLAYSTLIVIGLW